MASHFAEAHHWVSFSRCLFLQKCADHRVSNKTLYPTLARTFPPSTQVTKSVLAVLTHHGWRRFTIVTGSTEKWRWVADQVESASQLHGLTVNARFQYTELYYMLETSADPMPNIVERSYIDTRGMQAFLSETQFAL